MPVKRADNLGEVTHRQREIKGEQEKEFVFEEPAEIWSKGSVFVCSSVEV